MSYVFYRCRFPETILFVINLRLYIIYLLISFLLSIITLNLFGPYWNNPIASFYKNIQMIRDNVVKMNNDYMVQGMSTDKDTYQEIKEVTETVKQINPQTIFSFPIQPFYYSLAPKHASRYLTFEPQTSEREIRMTIADILRTKPEVIIFDPLQAEGLSDSLGLLSNFITTNYHVIREVKHRNILWIMTPKENKRFEIFPIFSLYSKNKDKNLVHGIQTVETGLVNAIHLEKNATASFIFTSLPHKSILESSVRLENDNISSCGYIIIQDIDAQNRKNQQICSDESIRIDLPESYPNSVMIRLSAPEESIMWNNLRIVEN